MTDSEQGECIEKETAMFSDEQRRMFIAQYYWSVLEAPPKEEWKGPDGTIAIILDQLHIPHGSYNSVKQVLRDVDAAAERGEDYNPAQRASGGQNKMIEHGSEDEQIIADQMEAGAGIVDHRHAELDPYVSLYGAAAEAEIAKSLRALGHRPHDFSNTLLRRALRPASPLPIIRAPTMLLWHVSLSELWHTISWSPKTSP